MGRILAEICTTLCSGSFLTNTVVGGTREEDQPNQQELADLAYFEGLLNEIIQRKRRIKRSTTNEGPQRKVTLREGLLERILEKSITQKSESATRNGSVRAESVRAETVGSLLATIPGILEGHEQSYNAIGEEISSIGAGLIAAITSVGQTMHQDAVQSHEDAVSMKESMHNDLDRSAQVMHADMEKNSKLVHNDAKALHQEIVKLDKTQHDGMHSLMSSFTNEDNNINGLTEALHDGLDMISMKMPEKNHLEEAVHDGFDSVVESLSDRDELGSIIHDGLHDLSEHIGDKSDFSQVLHSGLDGIQDALVSARNPVVNLPASFGTSCKSKNVPVRLFMIYFVLSWKCSGNSSSGPTEQQPE